MDRFHRKSHFSDRAHVQDLRMINVDFQFLDTSVIFFTTRVHKHGYIFDYGIIYNLTKYIHLQEIYRILSDEVSFTRRTRVQRGYWTRQCKFSFFFFWKYFRGQQMFIIILKVF